MEGIFVRIIAAIVVSVAQPIRFDANVGVFAFQVIGRTRRVLGTSFVRFVRRDVIFTIVNAVANLSHRYTPMISASELSWSA